MKIYGLAEKPMVCISMYDAARNKRSGKSYARSEVERGYGNRHGDVLILKTYEDFFNSLNALKKNPQSKDTLFFDDSSKFPRFKLQGTDFKRCIKESKANIFVFGNNILKEWEQRLYEEKNSYYSELHKVTIYEEKDKYLVVPGDDYYIADFKAELKNYGSTVEEIIENYYLAKDAKKIFSGNVMAACSGPDFNRVEGILNNTYPGIIFDNELDSLISSNMESLDEDSLGSIREMLESEDMAVVDMGLKLLPNYNILEYKLSVSLIIAMNNNKCSRSKMWNSTSVKQLRESLNYREPSSESMPACLAIIDEKSSYTDADIALARSMILGAVSNKIDNAVSKLKHTAEHYNVGIEINAQ